MHYLGLSIPQAHILYSLTSSMHMHETLNRTY